LHTFALTLFGLAAIDFYDVFGAVTITADLTLSLVFSVAYFVLVERALMGFRTLRPQYCSIYEPYYWWHERLWKVLDPYLAAFNGTPFKNVIWRLLGVRIGSRVFDDGASFTERTLTIIGNDCTLNVGSHIQCHSLEDGTFKSDYTTIGAGCTLGVLAFIHYGVKMGDGAVLAADSFLMKGEEIPPHACWGGNPARALTNYQIGSVTQMEPVAHLTLSQGWDQRDEHSNLTGQNTTDVQVRQDNNGICGARRPGQRREAPWQTQSGGKI
jgi:non-ribosomal peptide synthetase-like protein